MSSYIHHKIGRADSGDLVDFELAIEWLRDAMRPFLDAEVLHLAVRRELRSNPDSPYFLSTRTVWTAEVHADYRERKEPAEVES